MTELPIQISRLPLQPHAKPSSTAANPSSSSTGSLGFKLTILTSTKPQRHCCLVFRNFYVAWIRIVQVNVDGSSTELASNHTLMQHVHCEDDAQNWQLIKLDELPVSWNPHVLDSLCIFLSQPSPLWETWELRDVKIYMLPHELEAKLGNDTSSVRASSPDKKKAGVGWSSLAEGRLTQLLGRNNPRLTLLNPQTSAAHLAQEHAARCLDIVMRLRELLQN